MKPPEVELIERVIARDRAACRVFVDRLTPVIQSRVNAALYRMGRLNRQDVRDLTQEIFRVLLEDDAKILRSWDPARGASIESFVALIAERRVLSILASGKKSGSREQPSEAVELDKNDNAPTPELRAISRDLLERMLDELRLRLSDKGYEMFHYLFVEERDVESICRRMAMSADAVYTWKARIHRTIREAEKFLMSDPAAPSGKERGGRA